MLKDELDEFVSEVCHRCLLIKLDKFFFFERIRIIFLKMNN